MMTVTSTATSSPASATPDHPSLTPDHPSSPLAPPPAAVYLPAVYTLHHTSWAPHGPGWRGRTWYGDITVFAGCGELRMGPHQEPSQQPLCPARDCCGPMWLPGTAAPSPPAHGAPVTSVPVCTSSKDDKCFSNNSHDGKVRTLRLSREREQDFIPIELRQTGFIFILLSLLSYSFYRYWAVLAKY